MSSRLALVWARLRRLKDRGVTAPMVVKEFLKRRVAPLQRHSRPMWALLSSQDHMRFQEEGLPLKTRETVLMVLTGTPLPDDVPRKSCLLYRCENKDEFAASMPSFDEWGLRPIGLVGPRENPIDVGSSSPVPSSPRVRVQEGELRRRPAAQALKSTCRAVIRGRRPRELAIPPWGVGY